MLTVKELTDRLRVLEHPEEITVTAHHSSTREWLDLRRKGKLIGDIDLQTGEMHAYGLIVRRARRGDD